ncbi:hypothetical protein I7I53_11263 [Histoplasma capsulatum var. duboisii H88]|uniref:Uncharacterized protein n=1 Tax=Ajellomyces capsulatus (strain H88) TaxID=544711 RepID=A0A8A1LFJ4_AJEC8|nr:hypothetical protein I7I53_11263 [Histoplasma capsulatum var. duboisii H88]
MAMSKNKGKKKGPGITRTRHDTIMNYCPECQGCQVVRLPSPMPAHRQVFSFLEAWMDFFFFLFFYSFFYLP